MNPEDGGQICIPGIIFLRPPFLSPIQMQANPNKDIAKIRGLSKKFPNLR
jgi:hypothetical protein